MKVINKNEGTKIAYEESGTKLIFGEDEDLTVNCKKMVKDWPVQIDIMVDGNGNLISGPGDYYVAQIDIPATQYIDVDPDPENPDKPTKEPVPFSMDNVTLTLWSIDGLQV